MARARPISVADPPAERGGHLFPRGDDGSELAAAEKAFLA
jgi:hypothetical protein